MQPTNDWCEEHERIIHSATGSLTITERMACPALVLRIVKGRAKGVG